jgi:hypothetical protein
VFKMPEKQALFEDLYHYVRYVKPCKAELTMVALENLTLQQNRNESIHHYLMPPLLVQPCMV